MSVCFPQEFSRLMAKGTHQSDGKDTASLAPTPPKKRKAIHQDYFWEFIENQSEKSVSAEEEETVRGMSEVHYKLAAISSFYLASKVYQSGNGIHPSYAFAQLTQNQFSAKQIDDIELCIVKILNFFGFCIGFGILGRAIVDGCR